MGAISTQWESKYRRVGGVGGGGGKGPKGGGGGVGNPGDGLGGLGAGNFWPGAPGAGGLPGPAGRPPATHWGDRAKQRARPVRAGWVASPNASCRPARRAGVYGRARIIPYP